MPHPSEAVVNIRLQTATRPAAEVFREGLLQLIAVTEHIGSTFQAAVEKGPS
jgi:DNA-directed RNA polymerase subunit L